MLPDKYFGSQLCLGCFYLYYPSSYGKWDRSRLSSTRSGWAQTWARPRDLPLLWGLLHTRSSAVGLYLYPDKLLSLQKFLSWQGMHLSLNQNLSGNRTETRTSKPATVFRGALLACCLGGLFEIMHGDGQRGMISKVVIIMSLSGRELETAQGAGGIGDEQQLWAPAHTAPSNQRKPSGTKTPRDGPNTLWPLSTPSTYRPSSKPLFYICFPYHLLSLILEGWWVQGNKILADIMSLTALCWKSSLAFLWQPGISATLYSKVLLKGPFFLKILSLFKALRSWICVGFFFI